MAEIVWAEPALSDLDAIADYIALDKPEAASRLVQRIFSHVEKLEKHPELDSRVPELLPASRYVQIVESPCRIFYRCEKQSGKVFILGVMRGEWLFEPAVLVGRDRRA